MLIPFVGALSEGNDIYTVLLMHADGTNVPSTIDSSPSGHTFAFFGQSRQDTSTHKFGVSSLYFDGTGDYLTCDGSLDFAFGTGDFTVDFWFRSAVALSGTVVLIDFRSGATADLAIRVDAGKLTAVANSGIVITGTTSLVQNVWYHAAYVRASGVGKLYLNGVQEGGNYSDSINYTTYASRPLLGANGNGLGNYWNGWIDEVRVSRKARWTANFTPLGVPYGPILPVSGGNDLYTRLLLHGNGTNGSTSILDSSQSARSVTVAGNTHIDTAQSKFGGASIYFDGTSDYLSVNDTTAFSFNLSDFTIDFWYKPNLLGTQLLLDFRASGVNVQQGIQLSTDGSIQYLTNGATRILSAPNALMVGNWHHIAVTRASGTTRLFVNGAMVGGTYADSQNYVTTASRPIIGAMGFTLGSFSANGWMDELRISKGVARWSSNFNPWTNAY